jgi:simple sugar transport system permease protein
MLVSSGLLGAAWGAIPGLLKVKLRTNEIITTLMLNYVAIFILEYLVYGPWKDPVSFGFPVTPAFSNSAVLPLLGLGRLHAGVLICLFAGILLWAFFRFTMLGYELKACGEGAKVAAYARLPYNWLVLFVLTASGAFAGVAGFVEVSASTGRLMTSVMVGYGYTAIIVAWIARLRPVSIALASFLLAALRVGVENIQLDMQTPAAFGDIMEGLILLTILSGQFFEQHKLVRKGAKNAPAPKPQEAAP